MNSKVAYDLAELAVWIVQTRKCNALVWSQAGFSMFKRTDKLHCGGSG